MKLGDWLLSKGKIDQEQLARALRDQGFFGGRLGTSLIKLGYIDEDALGEYLADISKSRYAPPERLESIPPQVIATVPPRLAAKYRIVPIAIEGRKLHLAMRDPKDLIALDEIAFLTGLTIVPYVATEFRLVRAIERHYQMSLGTMKTIPVSGGTADPARPRPAAPAPQAAAPPGESEKEVGLDGLPLDAEAGDLQEPFVASRSAEPPPPREPDQALPATLDEWRMAQQEVPADLPEEPARPAPRAPVVPFPGHAAAPARAAPAPAPAAQGLEAVSERLRGADTRDEIFDAVLGFTAAQFRRAALFVVQQNRMIGWSGRGEGLSPARIRNVTVPLDRPSLFVFLRGGGEYYYGPVPDLPTNARFYLDLGCPPPARVLLLPLLIKDRAAVILYADHGPDTGAPPDIRLYRRLLAKASLALEVLILRNKIMMI